MSFEIGANCKIHPTASLNVQEGFLGDGAVINAGVSIEGTRVEIGREAFLDRGARIGGGSCFDPDAFLRAGDWLHMGVDSHINTARGVTVGHEFGCGVETKIFTHGAYLDSYNMGCPVQWAGVEIGDEVWMPNAWVNPGVRVGHRVVVAARSLVNRDLPARCLAGGTPATVLKADCFPRVLSADQKRELVQLVWSQTLPRLESAPPSFRFEVEADTVYLGGESVFDLRRKTLAGEASPAALLFKDQLRRNGIRFRYEVRDGLWQAWAIPASR